MHRADSPDFAPDIGNGNPGYQDTNPTNETIYAAAMGNAVQEEIAQVIEDAGLVLAASSAIDTANKWGQLSPAIALLIGKKGAFADATTFGMDPGNTAAANAIALNAAFASKQNVFIPAGNYSIENAITIPDGGYLLGERGATILTFTSTASAWILTDKRFFCMGISFVDNFSTLTLRINHDFDTGITIFDYCKFSGTNMHAFLVGFGVTECRGSLTVRNCNFDNCVDIIYVSSGSARPCNIYFIHNKVTTGGRFGLDTVSNGNMIFRENTFENVVFDLDNCQNIYIDYNHIIGTFTITPTIATNIHITHNIIPIGALSVVADSLSRLYFSENRDIDGNILAGHGVNGVIYTGSLSASQVVNNGATDAIVWNFNQSTIMGLTGSYAKDVVYSSGIFTYRGIGNGSTRIKSSFGSLTASISDALNVFIYLNGVKHHQIMRGYNFSAFPFWTIDTVLTKLSPGDTFSIRVENTSGAAWSISNATVPPPHVEVEGF